MYCPECGKKTRVIDSVISKEEEVYRHRKCESCGETFYTTEFVVDFDESFRRHLRDAQREKENRTRRLNGCKEVSAKYVPKHDIVIEITNKVFGKKFLEKFMESGVKVAKVIYDPERYISTSSLCNSMYKTIGKHNLPIKIMSVYKTVYLERTDM